jgi:hypothetical protein
VLVRFKKRHHTGAGTFNVGEVASFPAHYAGQLVAAKIAKRVRPDAVSQVTPREDPEPEHDDSVDREMADALRREGVWMPPSTAIDLETPRWR